MAAEPKSTAELQQFWNEMADWYLQYGAKATLKIYRSLVPFLKLSEAEVVVEAGCGPGNGIETYFSQLSPTAHILANDISSRFIDHIQTQALPRVTAITATNESLPYEDGIADRYIANLSLMLVESPEKMAKEAARVLKPGGIAGFSVWGDRNESQMTNILATLLDKYEPVKRRNGFHLSDPQKLRSLLCEAGFARIVTFREYMHFPFTEQNDVENLYLRNPEISGLMESMEDAKKAEMREDVTRLVHDLVVEQGHPLSFQSLVAIAFKAS